MIKILMINTVPTEPNGITNVIINLIQYINRSENFHADYVSINDPSNDIRRTIEQNKAQIYVIERNLSKPFQYIRKLVSVSKNYDIIHAHGNSATLAFEMFAAKCGGVKVRIAHSHNTTCVYKKIDKALRPIFYKFCNGRLACGKEAGEWLYESRKFHVLKNGIDTEKFKFDSAKRKKTREKLQIGDQIVLGHVGLFNEFKNQSFLIDIIAELEKNYPSRYKLVLVGEGERKKGIESIVKSRNLSGSVIFTGNTDHVENYLSAFDMILMPSINEGFPLTLLEEQANGLTCIASDRITKDVNITGNINFLPILMPDIKFWEKEISERNFETNDREAVSKGAIEKIKTAGYDSQLMVKDLIKYYAKCYALSHK